MFSHDLSRALLAFHGHFFVICHGHFLVYFSDESGNPFIKKKVPVTIFESPIFEKCHGQFTAFTGTFSKSFTGNQKLSRGIKQTLPKRANQSSMADRSVLFMFMFKNRRIPLESSYIDFLRRIKLFPDFKRSFYDALLIVPTSIPRLQ